MFRAAVRVYNTKGSKGARGSLAKDIMMIPPHIFLVFLGFYRLALPDVTVQGYVREPILVVRGMGHIVLLTYSLRT